MTEIIGDHGLFCIDDEDYAAFALAMQCNAEAIDSSLSSISTSLTGVADRPWVSLVVTSSVIVDDDAGSGTIGPDGTVGEAIQTTGSGTGTIVTTRNQFPLNPDFIPPGIWLVGSSINWTFGATTANSYRQLMVFSVPEIGGTAAFANANQLFRMRDYQGDGGATGALTVVGMMDTRPGNYRSFASFISHANVASNMTVTANTWRLWATYLGSGLAF